MLKTRLFPGFGIAAALLLLAACDRGEDESAQETPAVPPHSETLALSGVLDTAFAGETVPQVTVRDAAGQTLDLAAMGEPMLLNVWATWCAPCVVEMPLLDELAADMAGEVRVVTVSEDMRGADAVTPFFAENDLPNLPQWLDPDNDLAFAFGGGPVLPLTVLYDARGREVWRVIGAYDWGSEEARAAITEGLAGETVTPDAAPSAPVATEDGE